MGQVSAVQRRRTNKMCIWKETYYKGLAHAPLETEKSQGLWDVSVGRLEPQEKPRFQFESKSQQKAKNPSLQVVMQE